MKQYGVSVFVHIVLLVLFAIACYVLFIHNLWFSTLVAILLLVGTGIHLCCTNETGRHDDTSDRKYSL